MLSTASLSRDADSLARTAPCRFLWLGITGVAAHGPLADSARAGVLRFERTADASGATCLRALLGDFNLTNQFSPLRSSDPLQIGRYPLSARLGAGGMGVVYLGWDEDQPVALKVMRDELADDPGFRARFAREVAVLKRIGGVCTAAILAADAAATVPYLVTEYVNGPSLGAFVAKNGPLPPAALRALAVGLAEALRAMHLAGVVHRDLKPNNVLMSAEGPKVIDFGIASLADATAVTATNAALGSPGYLAPEQIRGMANSESADMFAWGATVAFAAAGRSPFGAGPAEAILYRILNDEPALSGFNDGLLRQLVLRCLSKDPGNRLSSHEVLSGLLAEENGTAEDAATTINLMTRLWQLPVATLALPTPARGLATNELPSVGISRQPSRKRRRYMVGGALTAGAAAAVAVLSLTHSGSATPARSDGSAFGSTPTPSVSASRSLQASPPSHSPQTAPAVAAAWPPLQDGSHALANASGEPPPFPVTVPGYTLSGAVTRETVRVFEDNDYSELTDFPYTMNGCAQQRFYVRWRSLNPNAVALAAEVYNDNGDFIVDSKVASGRVGWMSSYGCTEPGFKFRSSTDGSTLFDIVVEYQRWEPKV